LTSLLYKRSEIRRLTHGKLSGVILRHRIFDLVAKIRSGPSRPEVASRQRRPAAPFERRAVTRCALLPVKGLPACTILRAERDHENSSSKHRCE
jgi:hypothetical protein